MPVDRALLKYLEQLETVRETTEYFEARRWRVAKPNAEIREPILQETGIQHANLISDFEAGLIWKAGERRTYRLSRAQVDILWKMLLLRSGETLSKSELAKHLQERLGLPPHTSDVNKVFDNLIDKLAKISGHQRKTVMSWFLKTKDGLSLKKID